ncbi:hypothetical protein [Xenococcus sp. PCC 7305]|uniref:hypothetical protein n=1 Tax=Xenococcus sp. PCC 7305 TaxID=102125 RepID=UPI0002F1E57C|nr:hypothetical protein [Xenococcus sp. PCC 7305]
MDNSLEQAKIEARRKLNSLPPKEAQAIINKVLGADELMPDISQEIDWDDIPMPSSWSEDE